MSDSESEAEENLPSREECEERCQRFAEVTGTDTALAMFYLQDRQWDLDRALNAFFGDTGAASSLPKSECMETEGVKKETVSGENVSKAYSASDDAEPHRIRLMSWNIDGLDSANLVSRTKGVIDVINKEKPHIVFLQEAVQASIDLIEKKCGAYQIIPGGDFDYFTAILLHVGDVTYEDSTVAPFFTSKMLRNLLTVKCTVKGIKCHLITSHLESCKEHSSERKNQLMKAFNKMTEADKDRTVIFGGDLNMRDKELTEVGGIPEGVFDLWEVTGKRPEAKFTWDTVRNDNLEWSAKFRPRCRFDRLYIRHSQPKATLKPVYFELVGIERLQSCQRFPSDHWGVLSHFNIQKQG